MLSNIEWHVIYNKYNSFILTLNTISRTQRVGFNPPKHLCTSKVYSQMYL